MFHKWGHDALEGRPDENNVMWSVAILEFPDGSIEMVNPEYVVFTDKQEFTGAAPQSPTL